MKATTHKRNAERVERVVALIAARLDDPPNLEEMASAAAVSPFHFHRIYRALTGETTAETARRVRLARAASLLAEAARSVTEIALEVGYESSQAFAKAFRQAAGLSASEARQTPDRLGQLAEALARPSFADLDAQPPLEVSIVSVEPFNVAALRRTGPHSDLYEGYEALFAWLAEADLLANIAGIYGVPLDDPHSTAEAARLFDCCVDLGEAARGDAAAGVAVRALGGGLWLRARHVGPYERLDAFYDRLVAQALALPDYEIDERPSFNFYLDTPEDAPPEKRRMDAHLPLRRAGD